MVDPPKNKVIDKSEPARCPCGARLPDDLTKVERCPSCGRRLEKMPDRKA